MVGDLIPEVSHCVTAESVLRQDLGQPVLWTQSLTSVLPTESRTHKFLRTVKMRGVLHQTFSEVGGMVERGSGGVTPAAKHCIILLDPRVDVD